jgi:predicted nuclease with RNAse H fold
LTLPPIEFLKQHPKIVGIDLTGSEKKASGWCFLFNGVAETRRISTDDDLIHQTISVNPAVIAIDSPLSLPLGRLTVYDDDPGRQQFGITRLSERLLRKRGIRSYPTLIRSMQKLTLRGVLLAQEFRTLGFPVIECFPGGTQDILGLPRKQKSLPDLIKGLVNIGITGDVTRPGVSHDEIDAVTAALAGCFYMAGQYEAIGDEAEGQIMVPLLKPLD